jgi:hypothetical protein
MSGARTADRFDRLPWLADEPEPPTRAQRNYAGLAAWVVVAILLAVGAAYWFGTNRGREPGTTARTPPSTTVALPEPKLAQPEVAPDTIPKVEPIVVPTVRPAPQRRVPLPRPEARPVAKTAAKPKAEGPAAPVASSPPPPPVIAAPQPPRLWPSRQRAGASGRMVQIGAFGSIYQAKRGWWAMVRAYPALKRLPTVVRPARNSRGRLFYRLQIGTTSQAHSEILCQRMERIRFSCAVVGLPWKPKGVER